MKRIAVKKFKSLITSLPQTFVHAVTIPAIFPLPHTWRDREVVEGGKNVEGEY